MSSIDTLRWLAGSTDTGRATCSTLAITVSTWLALVRRTVSGSAAREQTWIMADLFAKIIASARRVGKGASRRAHRFAPRTPRLVWWARFALPTLRSDDA